MTNDNVIVINSHMQKDTVVPKNIKQMCG